MKQRLDGGKLRPVAGVFETEGHRWRRGLRRSAPASDRPDPSPREEGRVIPEVLAYRERCPQCNPHHPRRRSATSERSPYVWLDFRVFSRVRRTIVANRPGADSGRWTRSAGGRDRSAPLRGPGRPAASRAPPDEGPGPATRPIAVRAGRAASRRSRGIFFLAFPRLARSRHLHFSEDIHVDVSARIHADRAPGGDRDHRRPDRAAVAGRAGGPRGGPPRPVHQQPQAARLGGPELPLGEQRLPAADELAVGRYRRLGMAGTTR